MNSHLSRWGFFVIGALWAAAGPAAKPGSVTGTVARPVGAARPIGAAGLGIEPAIAPTDTPWVAPEAPQPTARYGSFRAASDSMRAIVRRAGMLWVAATRQ